MWKNNKLIARWETLDLFFFMKSFFLVESIKHWMGPYPRTPFSKLRSSYLILRFFRGPWTVGPFIGDFLDWKTSCGGIFLVRKKAVDFFCQKEIPGLCIGRWHLEPGTWWPLPFKMVGYQLDDDSKSLTVEKWWDFTTHPLKTGCVGFQVWIIITLDIQIGAPCEP